MVIVATYGAFRGQLSAGAPVAGHQLRRQQILLRPAPPDIGAVLRHQVTEPRDGLSAGPGGTGVMSDREVTPGQ